MIERLVSVYRVSAAQNVKGRPSFFAKESSFTQYQVALQNAVDDGAEVQSIVVCDGKVPFLDTIIDRRLHEVVEIDARSNGGSFRRSLEIALGKANRNDWIYMLEDDYVHRRDSITSLVRLAATFGDDTFFAPYYAPDFETMKRHRRVGRQRPEPATIDGVAGTLRRVGSATLTFAGPRPLVEASAWQFLYFAAYRVPRDWPAWWLALHPVATRLLTLPLALPHLYGPRAWRHVIAHVNKREMLGHVQLLSLYPGLVAHCEDGMISEHDRQWVAELVGVPPGRVFD